MTKPNTVFEMTEEDIDSTESLEVVSADEVSESEVDDSDIPINDEEAQNLRHQVQEGVTTLKKAYWNLAELLFNVRDRRLFMTWGYDKFDDYLNKELGIKKAKGYQLTKIYQYFERDLKNVLKDKPKVYEDIVQTAKDVGWAKAAQIASSQSITSENCAEILRDFKSLTLDEITVKCQSTYKLPKSENTSPADVDLDDEAEKDPKIRKVYMLNPFQNEKVDSAIETARSVLREGATVSTALSMVCEDFLATKHLSSGDDRKVNIANLMAHYERILGCSFVAFDDRSNKIVYGQDTFEKVVESFDESVPEEPVQENEEEGVSEEELIKADS